MSSGLRILHVEDSPDDAFLAARELRQGGLAAEVRVAAGAADFARALAEFRADLVLCDYNIPDLRFEDVLARARAAWPDAPFICLSGTVGEERTVELVRLGVTDLVLKDHLARLAPSVRRALDEARERAERRRAEEELRSSREQLVQSQKLEAIGRLAGGIAHDFNNILTAITGYAELALATLPADAPQRADVQEISAASDRASKLTRQLLAFGRRQVLDVRVIDLNEVVRGVGRMLGRMIGEDVTLVTHLAGDLPRVRADASQIEVILMNLAINARDAMPRGGTLTVRTRRNGRWAELEVADTGEGMTPEVRARAFEPFFTTKPVGQGTGLGLSTVYGIVRQSNGEIDVESEPGRGAKFRVRLPATDAPAEAPAGARRGDPTRLGGRGEKILVVEDELPVRSLVRRLLEARGYRPVPAASPSDALRRLDEEPSVALAILDVVMPGMDGPALAARLRERRPGLKILMMSGYANATAPPADAEGRPYPLVSKPFATAHFLSKVRDLLAA